MEGPLVVNTGSIALKAALGGLGLVARIAKQTSGVVQTLGKAGAIHRSSMLLAEFR